MCDFDKETKHPSAKYSGILCDNYIVNSGFVHREVVIHMPAWSSTEVSWHVARNVLFPMYTVCI